MTNLATIEVEGGGVDGEEDVVEEEAQEAGSGTSHQVSGGRGGGREGVHYIGGLSHLD